MNTVLQTFINQGVAWISQPQTIVALITFALTIPSYIKKVQDQKGKNIFEKALIVAREESFKLAQENLTNDKKRAELESRILKAIPENQQKYIDPVKLRIIAEGVYHSIVKKSK